MLTIILILAAVALGWVATALALALFIGRAVRIADRRERATVRA